MDKNQTTGLVLLSLMLLVYFMYFSPTPEELQQQAGQNGKDSIPTQVNINKDTVIQKQQVTLPDSILKKQFGFFGPAKQGKAKAVVIENEDVKVTLSTKGGAVQEVLLKKHVTYLKEPLILLDEQSSKIKEVISTTYGDMDLNALYYQASSDGKSATFTITGQNGEKIERKYTLQDAGYVVDYDLKFDGLNQIIRQEPIRFNWVDKMKKVEKELSTSRQRSTVNFYMNNQEMDYVSETATEKTTEVAENPVKWVSMKQKFFNAAIITDEVFNDVEVSTEVDEADTSTVETGTIDLTIPLAAVNSENANLRYYFGPNDYDLCEAVAPGFQENVYLGWWMFRPINLYVIMPIFNFFDGFIDNYGLIILILVFLVKSAVFPLTYKSYIGMAKMKVLKPEIDALKEEYGDDQQKIQQEQMKLMAKFGVSPASGCIPMLAQTPIWLAMFNFFPNAIQLRQQSFLWADDLSTYDSILDLPFDIPMYGAHVSLFTLLMTAVTLINVYFNNQMNANAAAQQGPMKYMQYLMPIMFLFFLNKFSSGLTYYYFVSTTISIGQQVISKRWLIDEKKIRARLEENHKKKGKKKSLSERIMSKMSEASQMAEEEQKRRQGNGQAKRSGNVKKRRKKL